MAGYNHGTFSAGGVYVGWGLFSERLLWLNGPMIPQAKALAEFPEWDIIAIMSYCIIME